MSPTGKIRTLTSTHEFNQQKIIHRKLKTIDEDLSQKYLSSNESNLWTGTIGEEGCLSQNDSISFADSLDCLDSHKSSLGSRNRSGDMKIEEADEGV